MCVVEKPGGNRVCMGEGGGDRGSSRRALPRRDCGGTCTVRAWAIAPPHGPLQRRPWQQPPRAHARLGIATAAPLSGVCRGLQAAQSQVPELTPHRGGRRGCRTAAAAIAAPAQTPLLLLLSRTRTSLVRGQVAPGKCAVRLLASAAYERTAAAAAGRGAATAARQIPAARPRAMRDTACIMMLVEVVTHAKTPLSLSLSLSLLLPPSPVAAMGLCRCRKVTSLFCFQHRINVCDQCILTSHSTVRCGLRAGAGLGWLLPAGC